MIKLLLPDASWLGLQFLRASWFILSLIMMLLFFCCVLCFFIQIRIQHEMMAALLSCPLFYFNWLVGCQFWWLQFTNLDSAFQINLHLVFIIQDVHASTHTRPDQQTVRHLFALVSLFFFMWSFVPHNYQWCFSAVDFDAGISKCLCVDLSEYRNSYSLNASGLQAS